MTEIRGACPAHSADTGGSDSYSFNSDKGVGHCLSCGLNTWTTEEGDLWGRYGRHGKPFPISEGAVVEEDDWASEPQENDCMTEEKNEGAYIPLRGITKDTMEFFGVKYYKDVPWELYDPKTRKVVDRGISDEIRATYPNGSVKTRRVSLPKDHPAHFTAKGPMDALFGMNLFPAGCAKKLTIVEGDHFDTLSAYQMLKGSYLNPVVSLPGASPSGKLWEKCKKYLDSFEEIILSVDNDDPGNKVAQLISEIFPGKVTRMEHGQYKDANDFLQAGDAQAYKQAWWKAKKVKPDNILIGGDDFLSLYEDSPDFEYFETGIKELDEKMLGICKGYVTLIQAESGLGKTEFTRYLEWQCLTNSTYKIAAMHLEETKLRSILGLVSYKLEDNLTIKKFIEEKGREEDVKHAIKELTDSERFMLFDYDMQEGHEELVRQVRYLVAALKVDFIVIEPIQDCVTGTSSEKEGKLADLITQLSTLAAKTNVGIVVVAHQNSEGGAMYSSMITKRAAFEILLKRDRESEDLVEQNRTHVIIGRKNRTGLGSGKAGAVDFDLESYTLKPIEPPKAPVVESRDDF